MAGADNAEARCASAFAALGVPALGDDAVRRLGRADAVVLAKSLEAVAAKAKAGCASAAADDPDEVVELNVGGTVFTTLRATLVAFESSRLEAMLSGRWRVPRDAAGRVFVDRDPALFGRVLAFLRDPAAGVALPAESAAACDELVAEFEWYGLREVALPPLLPGSTVLTRQQGDDAARLLAGLPRHEGRWRLMMRGSQDGFAPSVFHAACDELEESIVAVRTAVGSVVVGYMDAPWGGSVGMNMARSRCALAVLETLRGRAALLLRPQVDPAKACVVCQDPTFGPIFGLFALGGAEGGPLRNDMAVMAGSDSTSVCFGIGCPGSMFERPPGWTDARLLSGSASGCVGLEDVEVWAPALDEPAAAE
ncbi:hypothetical protein FNF27_03177 [Cafeteria roenbergensis]|uniref:BTB domain-containing protein n=1 Tax=Cafeteria roenbergensis TaxID=33653 RepID=A0A5A8EFH6_CAFRO|nr:hypothetical protein FNF27_03177 [Cafeteria roenbergensis]|mmetsp:Transcript_443/g.1626  ORF Transcript_443/g.1626 Transcript_443/m.1626 type:complete len:366 (+) Transcript_443:195-1292(+)